MIGAGSRAFGNSGGSQEVCMDYELGFYRNSSQTEPTDKSADKSVGYCRLSPTGQNASQRCPFGVRRFWSSVTQRAPAQPSTLDSGPNRYQIPVGVGNCLGWWDAMDSGSRVVFFLEAIRSLYSTRIPGLTPPGSPRRFNLHCRLDGRKFE
jgi:hypothetical protein